MSAYTERQTQINDTDILKECLKEKGYPEVEHSTTPKELIGYAGDKRKDTAEIIIRRKHVGSVSNDIGFKKQADGTYSAIISDYDKRKHGTEWMSDLARRYAEKKIRKTASQNGMTFVKKQANPDGSFKLQFVKA